MFATAQFLEQFAWRTMGVADDRIGLVASLILAGGVTELIVNFIDGNLDMTVEQLVDDATALLLTMGRFAVETALDRRGSAPS
jgi:hypothetical protein